MKRLTLALLLLLSTVPLYARGKLDGFVEKGGQQITVGGQKSTDRVQKSYPSSTVTVYNAGTLTLATIYSDSAGTAKANPFSADSNGYWFFWAEDGDYDVNFSGPVSYTRSWLHVGNTAGVFGNVSFDITANPSPHGIIYKNATPFLHDFTGGGNAGNTFVGFNAGNLTMNWAGARYSPSEFEVIPVPAGDFRGASANSAVGYYALASNTTGYNNTAVGATALNANTSGYHNTAVGEEALLHNTTGQRSTAVGFHALINSTTQFLSTTITGATNASPIRITTSAPHNYVDNMTVVISGVAGNTAANGTWEIQNLDATHFDLGCAVISPACPQPVSVGNGAYAGGGTAVGENAGRLNTAIGMDSQAECTYCTFNSSLGLSSLFSNTLGSYNTAGGVSSLYYLNGPDATYANRNTAYGANSGLGLTSGSDNTMVGYQAGYGDGSANVPSAVDTQMLYLGEYTGRDPVAIAAAHGGDPTFVMRHSSAIGYNARVGCDYCMALGGTGGDAVFVGVATTAPAYRMDISSAGSIGLTNPTAAPANSQSLPGSLNFDGYGWYFLSGSSPIKGQIALGGAYSGGTGVVDPYISLFLRGSSDPAPVELYRFGKDAARMAQGLLINTAGGAGKPTCSSATRGEFWYAASGAGVKDTVEVCAKDAADAYAWRTIY